VNTSATPESQQSSSEIVLASTPNFKKNRTDGQGTSTVPAPEKKASEISIGATGPRTSLGKNRSRRNATKHGIFSSVVVLPGESRADYESLLSALCSSFDPVGSFEEMLVEKLATLLWRQRRLLNAESAEIRSKQDFLEWDKDRQQSVEADTLSRNDAEADFDVDNMDVTDGLIWHIENGRVLARCLELLNGLREEVNERSELSLESVESTFKRIYGPSNQLHLNDTLYDDFAAWCATAAAEEEERKKNDWASPEGCKKYALAAINSEIRRLKEYQKKSSAIDLQRIQNEKLRQSVPDSPSLDRLMRYEASLERAFDRTLNQLERAQRMRKGQAVPPPLKVEIS